MGCGCGKTKFTPPTAAQKQQADQAAQDAAGNVIAAARGRRAPGYTWNGPDPEPAAENA